MTDETPWLTRDQLRAWMKLVAVMELLPAALDQQLQRDADLTHFDYMVVAMLSETDGRTLRMSALAAATNASLPRLSHVVSRLEKRGLVTRCPSVDDRRATDVRLTDAGYDAIVAAAPDHVRTARRFVIDALDDDQVGQLDGITRALLERLDPEGRFAALTYPREEDDPALCEARLTGAEAGAAGAGPAGGAAAGPTGVLFREVTADDTALLRHATLAAMNWQAPTFTDAELDRPDFAHYSADFDPSRDHGVVAVDGDGPVGVAWVRFLSADDPGYGFVSEDVPELTLAVEPRGRGRGIGTALLTRLLAAGRTAGWPGVSLSVEDGNTGARILYERVGFRTVGRNGDSDTMLVRFRPAPGGALVHQ
ncbi:bifunctional helix-turn-helix transcriptional regulator/GNAT family N-acetyltransferase [Curtobacterium sp. NPDC089185]|uniref:bifunctional helix-turn-helix transcriptional regulator/GNAT family N-acetyltransferase n=1 Tax=Curtobacterium sp. NPDC089185 TaxID=3154968 RepID=UPI003417AE96